MRTFGWAGGQRPWKLLKVVEFKLVIYITDLHFLCIYFKFCFLLIWFIFIVQEFWIFNCSNPSIFSLVVSSFSVMLRKDPHPPRKLHKYSSVCLLVLLYAYLCALAFKSLLHLQFILMKVVRHRYNIRPPQTANQLFQYNLLNNPTFPCGFEMSPL